MHSSRVRTARFLPVSHWGGGSAPGGVCLGVLLLGGYLPLVWGVYPSMQWGTPHCEQNDRQVQKYYLAPNFVCGR